MAISRRRKALFVTILLATTYLAAELSLTFVEHLKRRDTLMLYEDSSRTVLFDPIRGYTMTKVPARFCRITKGEFEYIGCLRGNNQGFPDRDDFQPYRTHGNRPRFAVLGDSFTAGQFLDCNWPDRVEDALARREAPIELMNFAVDGAGLANWWSIVQNHIFAENYQMDGVVFAVWGDNLHRTFTTADHRFGRQPGLGRSPTWDPSRFPKTLEAAQAEFVSLPGYLVCSADFDQAVQGNWRRIDPRPLQWALWNKMFHIARSTQRYQPEKKFAEEESKRKQLIDDLGKAFRSRGIPCLVIFLPHKAPLLAGQPQPAKLLREMEAFAHTLGATYWDATEIFADLDREAIANLWFPADGHWNQRGSDLFAERIAPKLAALANQALAQRRERESTK